MSNRFTLTRGAFEDHIDAIAGPIDLAFVDGIHAYDFVIKQWQILQPRMSSGGLVLFDDISYGQGMREAWLEIARSSPVAGAVEFQKRLGLIECRSPGVHQRCSRSSPHSVARRVRPQPFGRPGGPRIQARPRIQTSPAGVSANETPHLLSGQRFAAQRPGSPVPMMVARLRGPESRCDGHRARRRVLGWHRRGNLGDDAIYDAVRLQLPQGTFLDLPRLPYEVVRAATTGLNRSLRRGVQVMGGGTLVGDPVLQALGQSGRGAHPEQWKLYDRRRRRRPNVHPTQRPLRQRRAEALGTNTFRVSDGVGPRSAELLAEVGLNVEVSGDPALLPPRPDVVTEDGLIGLNLGFGDDDLWGQGPAMVAQELSSAVRHLSAQGHRFIGILMNRDDKRWTELALNGVAADIVVPPDACAAARELARCSVAIVSRLHAGILAAVSGTPVVSLILPKCRDFALSIDDERSLIRTDKLSSTSVVDGVGFALAESSQIRNKTQAAVAKLRHRLQVEYGAVRKQLGLNGDERQL